MPDDSTARFVERIDTALAGPPDGDEDLCTVVGWLAEHGDAPKRFLAQLRRKGLRLTALDGAETADGRAAIPVQLVASEPLGVPVYLLAMSAGAGAWALEGITRSAAHATQFVSGKLPSLLRWSALPASPELSKLGKALLEQAREGGSDNPIVTEMATRLAIGHTLAPVAAVAIADLGRGAITYTVDTGDGSPADWTIYLLRGDDGHWTPLRAEWAQRVGTLLELDAAS